LCFADAINTAGVVVGYSRSGNYDDVYHALEWSGTTPIDIGSLGGSRNIPDDINDAGEVVGSSELSGTTTEHGFLYASGTMYDLNNLLVPGSGVTIAGATAINDEGQIVASSNSGPVLLTPFAIPEPSCNLLYPLALLMLFVPAHKKPFQSKLLKVGFRRGFVFNRRLRINSSAELAEDQMQAIPPEAWLHPPRKPRSG
jgi:probable HAF family extracellular repeat protein